MKIVGINGSPRSNGNTHYLVEQVLKGSKEAGADISMYDVNEMNFKGCQGCLACKSKGKCVQNDDLTAVLDEIAEADGIVLGTPVYMWQMTGQLKLVLDRFLAFLNPDFTSRLKPGKKAVLAVTQGAPDEKQFMPYFESVASVLKFGGLSACEILIAGGNMEKNDVEKNTAAMTKAGELGKWLVS
ncbi:MAG: flavodoxin family protein [Candidatus Xenobiia bacterium LiM19]